MSELVTALPKEVLEFTADCRKQIHRGFREQSAPNTPNFRRKSELRDQTTGLVWVETYTQQGGRFNGNEYVEREPKDETTTPEKYYDLSFHGGYNPDMERLVKRETVVSAHRGLLINPAVRFGNPEINLDIKEDGVSFVYTETSNPLFWGAINLETMSLYNIDPELGTRTPLGKVYTGSNCLMIYCLKE